MPAFEHLIAHAIAERVRSLASILVLLGVWVAFIGVGAALAIGFETLLGLREGRHQIPPFIGILTLTAIATGAPAGIYAAVRTHRSVSRILGLPQQGGR